jgi:hypothetical protein
MTMNGLNISLSRQKDKVGVVMHNADTDEEPRIWLYHAGDSLSMEYKYAVVMARQILDAQACPTCGLAYYG